MPTDPFKFFPDIPVMDAPSTPVPPSMWGRPTDYQDERVSSGFGRRAYTGVPGSSRNHPAIDVVAPTSGTIGAYNAAAVAPGTVISTTPERGYGNVVVVDHGDGYTTQYSHLDTTDVKPGDTVSMGQRVGNIGATGLNGMGNHLDVRFEKDGVPFNPEEIGYGIGSGRRGALTPPAAFGPGPVDDIFGYSAQMDPPADPVAPTPVPTPRPEQQFDPALATAVAATAQPGGMFDMGTSLQAPPTEPVATPDVAPTPAPERQPMAWDTTPKPQTLMSYAGLTTPEPMSGVMPDVPMYPSTAAPVPTARPEAPAAPAAPVAPMMAATPEPEQMIPDMPEVTYNPPPAELQTALQQAIPDVLADPNYAAPPVPSAPPTVAAPAAPGGMFAPDFDAAFAQDQFAPTPTMGIASAPPEPVAPSAPVQMAQPAPAAPVAQPSAPAPLAQTAPPPAPAAVAARPTPTVMAPQQMAAPPAQRSATPTVAAPSMGGMFDTTPNERGELTPTMQPGYAQGLAPSVRQQADAMALGPAPEGMKIGYSALQGGPAYVPDSAGPEATGSGLFGFLGRDFGFGGSGDQAIASRMAATPGRIGGGFVGGALGGMVGGPIGGLVGSLGGSWLGGRYAERGMKSLGAPGNSTDIFGGNTSSDGNGMSDATRSDVESAISAGRGGLW